ncbi:MAG: ribonuclease domain-containing protein [Chloroflexota bacterium]
MTVRPTGRGRRLLGLVGILVGLVLSLAACGGGSATRSTPAPTVPPRATATVNLPSGWTGGTVHAGDLPREARDTMALIAAGGPFPYRQDGQTFGNREGLLPSRPSGAYREYTVETPGSADRGARRIVVGDAKDAYYTDDHYATFRFVIP